MKEEIISMGLDLDVTSMPFQSAGPVPPFTNVVMNFTVCTAAHRDKHDKGLCGIFVLGCFKGGELALYEPGLVIPLQSGDFVVFDST